MTSRRLAEFLANAATACGFDPVVTARDDEFREAFIANRPEMVALDLGMPGMDGVELIRFLADQDYRGPVLIVSGFDRRVLEFGVPAWRSPRSQHGRPGRKAGPARGARRACSASSRRRWCHEPASRTAS